MFDKAEAYDRIAARFFQKNFGNTSKSEIELLMFQLYLEQKRAEKTDSYILSDHKIGKELGLTPRRVQTLREKARLQFSDQSFDWQKEFLCILANTRNLSGENGTLKITIPDAYLFHEIEDQFQDRGFTVDYALNGRILCIRDEDLFAVLQELLPIEDRERIREKIVEQYPTAAEDESKDLLQTVSRCLEAGTKLADLLSAVSALFAPETLVFKVLSTVLQKILKGRNV